MSVLESLGINLYSNAAAVLSELVANAWDADATAVSIDWRKTDELRVVVTDNGRGMDVEDMNKRFLKVGYKKRIEEGSSSPKWARPFMGRKGIGKLSVFSIADRVAVYSKRGTEAIGLEIAVADLRDAITQGQQYHPSEVTVPNEYRHRGTAIVLSELKHQRADLTASALRKRLARRFDVTTNKPASKGGFAIKVNGKRITHADRQELKKLEFLWEFGERHLPDGAVPPQVGRFVLDKNVIDAAKGWKVRGWIGTAKVPTDLTDDEEAGSLKNVIVLARGRPIQEGIIEKLDFSRLFGNYVTGQIEADFLDLDDGYDDIATSDRQRLIEDDPRVLALQRFLRDRFLEASEHWAELRPRKEAKDALEQYPKLREWVDARPPWQREAAERMIGTIAGIEFEGEGAAASRATLFRSGILAFERVGLRQATRDLEALASLRAEDLLPVLADQASYESALWVDILRSRVQAIAKFQDLRSANEKERVLQEHLFGNLWLLDASWERAASSAQMEEDLRRTAPEIFSAGDAAGTGRLDIRYATTSRKHVIVELKRYAVKVDVTVLAQQGSKYAVALRKLLDDTGHEDEDIEVVFVLGKRPGAKGKTFLSEKEYVSGQLKPLNGRYVLYDELITNAKQQYSEYLEASAKAKELDELLGTLDDSQV